ncbi:Trypsin domain containing protein [Trichuris trichiura]|uniref:Trypsin domain containing protein n=1 Tax=Trichuris trichiura TaxID=36087 RepID=A0A077Z2Z8_TRITR|nr:Trypsin domain containing protein [Trichuris trichiura]
MFQFDHWAALVWLLCLTLLQREAASQCGDPEKFGGQPLQAYSGNGSEVMPWTVVIRDKLGNFKCLGSIIPDYDHSGRHWNVSGLVLTAGSCFRRVLRKRWGTPSSYRVYAGLDRLRLLLNRGQKAEAKKIRIMPYNAVNEKIWNGIAMITLKKPFLLNADVSPVCIPKAYAVPSNSSKCFVSTYNGKRLDENAVKMVPGAVCNFSHFPELTKTNGLCSHHDGFEAKKSLGSPLVCFISGKAYQYGVYLSELATKEAFPSQKQVFHFYGHVRTVLETNPMTAFSVIQLGWSEKKPLGKKSSSSDSYIRRPCKNPPPRSPPRGPGTDAPSKCGKPVKPARRDPVIQHKPVYCGDTITFGRSLQSYVVGNNAQDMFPWNVIIISKKMGTIRCLGSLVHNGNPQQTVNGSDIILTAAECFGRYMAVSVEPHFLVFAGLSRFSPSRRRGTEVKIANANIYGLLWGNHEMRRGIAVLKLERPLLRRDNIVPVCLPQTHRVPPPFASCYVSYYDKREHRIDEEIVMITRNARCLEAAESANSEYRGLCAIEERKKLHIQLGSPMVCLLNGRAYQYGVFLNQLSLKINDKVKQNLGFYGEIDVARDVLAGKKVQTLPERLAHQPQVGANKPVPGSSSSASRETQKRPFIRIPELYFSIPTVPQLIGKSEQKNSSSAAFSDSSSHSSSTDASESHENMVTSKSADESDESTRTIRLNVKLLKPRLAKLLGIHNSKSTGRSHISSSSTSQEIKPYLPSSGTKIPVVCSTPGQRPIKPAPGSTPSSGVVVCPTPGNAIQVVPVPTPLPVAEYPSSSIEAVSMVILPLLPKYDMSNRTIADHEHILVRDNIVGESAIAKGHTASCDIIGAGNSMHSLLPGKSNGEITGNEIDNTIPDVTGALITGPCMAGNSSKHNQYDHLPGASAVHIYIVSAKSIEPLCTGTLYTRRGQEYSDEVLTASRCVPPSGGKKYQVYVGSLLPRRMAVDQLNRTLIEVAKIYNTPFYEGYDVLKEVGMTMLKLKHRVKVINGIQPLPLPYSSTGPSTAMYCFVSGVCQHGMPVRAHYQLLTQTECKRHLGEKFLPSAMYCGVGRKEILQYPVGSPLLCRSAGKWVQFGIYDHSFPAVASGRASASENEIILDDIAIFIKLEGNDVPRVQNFKVEENSIL